MFFPSFIFPEGEINVTKCCICSPLTLTWSPNYSVKLLVLSRRRRRRGGSQKTSDGDVVLHLFVTEVNSAVIAGFVNVLRPRYPRRRSY